MRRQRLARILRVNLLAVMAGVVIGLVGRAFFFLIDRGYAGMLAVTRADNALAPGWLLGAAIGAVLVGIAVFLTRRWAPEASGSGIQEIEGALKGVRPLPRARLVPVKFAGGLLAMTAGLILGREGPTIQIGGAIGAAVGQRGRLSEYDTKALIAAGCGAGLGVAFNAPLGGMLFVVEELREKFSATPLALNGVLAATLAATLTSVGIGDPGRLLPIPLFAAAGWRDLALAIPFAVLVGVYATAFNALLLAALEGMRALTQRLGGLPGAIAVGSGMGALVALWPDATGGGEGLTTRVLVETPGMTPLLALAGARTVLFAVGYAAGTPGGLFAPQLALGALLGLLFAGAINALGPGLIAAPGMFAVAGMAALLAATVRAPLTGVALIVEMSGAYALLPLVLLAAAVASLTAEALGAEPIYDRLLARTLRLSGANAGDARSAAGGGRDTSSSPPAG